MQFDPFHFHRTIWQFIPNTSNTVLSPQTHRYPALRSDALSKCLFFLRCKIPNCFLVRSNSCTLIAIRVVPVDRGAGLGRHKSIVSS